MFKFLKSKTVWGGIVSAIGVIGPAFESGLFGPKAQAITIGTGIILGAVGVKSAISKPPVRR